MIDPEYEPQFRYEYWLVKRALVDWIVRPFSVALSSVVGAGVGLAILDVALTRLRASQYTLGR